MDNVTMNEFCLATDTVEIVYPPKVVVPESNTLFMTAFGRSSSFYMGTNNISTVSSKQTFTNISDYTGAPVAATFAPTNVGYLLRLTTANITLPASSSPLTFWVTFLRNSVRYLNCSARLSSILTGTLGMSVSPPSSNVVGGQALYTIVLTTTLPVPAGGGFIVTFPGSINLAQYSACGASSSGTPYGVSCAASTTSSTITGTFSSDVPAGTVTLTFSPLGNPVTAVASLLFSASTYSVITDTSSVIDSRSNFPYSPSFVAATMTGTVATVGCGNTTGETCLVAITTTNVVNTSDTTLVKVTVPADMMLVEAVNLTRYGGTAALAPYNGMFGSNGVTYQVGENCLAN